MNLQNALLFLLSLVAPVVNEGRGHAHVEGGSAILLSLFFQHMGLVTLASLSAVTCVWMETGQIQEFRLT